MSKRTSEQILAAFAANPEAKQKASQKEIEMVAGLSNDKTNADEALNWTKGILYVLTAFVIYLGFNYYLNTFTEMFPYPVAVLFAIGLPLLIEVGKIRLAARALRSWWFGWINDGAYATAYWGFISLLAIGCYAWSYSISTGGIKEVAKATATEKNQQTGLIQQIKSATETVDARLANLDASDSDAKGMKTKKGKVAWSGQSIMMNNAELKKALQQERAEIIANVKAEYEQKEVQTEVKVNKWAIFVEKFGGWGEVGTAICIFICSFFDKRLVLANLKDGVSASPTPASKQDANLEDALSAYRKGSNIQNSSLTDRPIGFFVENPYRDPVPQNAEGVTQYNSAVSHPSQQPGELIILGSNQILEACSKRVKSDIPNLLQKNGDPVTVHGRISKALDETLLLIGNEGFCPSRDLAIQTYQYFADRAFPALNGVGRPYDKDHQFIERLMQVIKATEPANA